MLKDGAEVGRIEFKIEGGGFNEIGNDVKLEMLVVCEYAKLTDTKMSCEELKLAERTRLGLTESPADTETVFEGMRFALRTLGRVG